MFGLILFVMGVGVGQAALVLSRYGKKEQVELRRPGGGLCGDYNVYCNQPRGRYPKSVIDRALRRTPVAILNMFDKEDEMSNLVKRDADDYYEACPSSHDHVRPRVGTNTSNQQRFLVNGVAGLVQTVQVTTCDSQAGESCGGGVFGGKTRCQQNYSRHKLVALDEERGELVVETFTFPSCCSCMVHRGYGS